jgi:site-specific recombinase XerD
MEKPELKPVIGQIARIFKKHDINYLQSKYIFKQVRKELHLTAPRKRGKGTVKRISRKEYQDFVNAAYEKSSLTGLMMQTLYETGTRVNEFTNLNADDIMIEEKRITIREGKGDKRREVPIEEHLARSLQIHLNGREAGPLFLSTRGKRFTNRRIQQIVSDITTEAGIKKDVTPHSMRHTRLTQLAEDGINVEELKDFAGHEKIETTQIYIRTAASNLEASFRKATNK